MPTPSTAGCRRSPTVKVLLNEELDDPATWSNLADWLGLDGGIPDVDGTEGNRAGRARWKASTPG